MQLLKSFIFLFLALGCCLPEAFGQYNPDDVHRKARKWYREAQEGLKTPTAESLGEAIELLKKATHKAPGYLDAYALMASIFTRDRDYPKALENFKKANSIDSVKMLPAYDLYARAAAGTGDFPLALNLINRYLERRTLSERNRKKALQWKKNYQFGKKSAQRNIPFEPINLGDSINSKDAEYSPALTINRKELIFTRNLNGRNEDFFVSRRKDSQWTKAVPLTSVSFGKGEGINSAYNEGSGTISQDGKILLFTICDRKDGLGSCDIYYTVKRSDGWTKPGNIGPPVNSPYWDSQPSLSPDGQDLYFVSNRPGGHGGSDIYVSHLQADGRWGQPENLGDSVNTPGEESSPFIHADNTTLYFASDGHQGVGGVDLFYVRKEVDGSWGSPQNMGYPINTVDHDGSIFVTADGKMAYFASDRKDSRGELDLYKFKLYPEARPIMTLYVHGRVFNKNNGDRVTASIALIDLQSGKTVTNIPTDPDGSYLITLPVGKNYAFNVSKPGYLFYSEHFSLEKASKWQPYKIDIPLQPIEKNTHIVLENIFFEFDKYDL